MQVAGLNMGVTGRVNTEREMIVGLEWAVMSKVVVAVMAAINDGLVELFQVVQGNDELTAADQESSGCCSPCENAD